MGGVRIHEVRIRNFRCIQTADVTLERFTILVGESNSGKTTFLEALVSALGGGRGRIAAEDIFIGPDEAAAPSDRELSIDVLLRPQGPDGQLASTFPRGDPWLELWGESIQQDEAGDFLAFRCALQWDPVRGEHLLRRTFLLTWAARAEDSRTSDDWVQARQLDHMATFFLDAQRDLGNEMRSRTSFWGRLVADVTLDPDTLKAIEEQLNKLNAQILADSKVLSHVEAHLRDLAAGSLSAPTWSLAPLPRSLRDFSHGIDLAFGTADAVQLPISKHGTGTRSLAAILVFRAFCEWRGSEMAGDSWHPVLALEEPEAHLHPHIQRAVFALVQSMPGQVVLTTHSPFFASQADPKSLRYFRKVGAATEVCALSGAEWEEAVVEKVRRTVMLTRGELMFARCVIFTSGETEEYALPTLFEGYFGATPEACGVSIVGVGGDGGYEPFLRLVVQLGIPWVLFSDGEDAAKAAVSGCLAKVGLEEDDPRVIVLPGGHKFESYVASSEFQSVVAEAIWVSEAQTPQHLEALRSRFAVSVAPAAQLTKKLCEQKVLHGRIAAQAMVASGLGVRGCPEPVQDLFSRVAEACGIAPNL